jgi:hypothetical protein
MIRLIFESSDPGYAITLGPAPLFRVGGNFIRQGPEKSVVARYRNHFWEVQERHFTRYDCLDSASIHFEDIAGDPSESFGPFVRFWVADGALYAERNLFAKFVEESQLWHCYPTDTYWPIMVITQADRAD